MRHALNFATTLFSAQDERTLGGLAGHLIENPFEPPYLHSLSDRGLPVLDC